MNCTSARIALAVIQPSSPDSDVREFAAELAHVRECPECQAYQMSVEHSDRQLAATMRNVAIPAGFKSRLLQQLASIQAVSDNSSQLLTKSSSAADCPSMINAVPIGDQIDNHAVDRMGDQAPHTTASGKTTSEDNSYSIPTIDHSQSHAQTNPAAANRKRIESRRLFALSGIAATIAIVLGLWWLVGQHQPIRLHSGDILAMCQDFPKQALVPFQNSFQVELPSSTLRFTRDLTLSKALSLRQGGNGNAGTEIGAVFSFSIPNSPRVPGYLIVINLKQVEIADLEPIAPDFGSASVQYPQPHHYPTAVWRDGSQLFICYAATIENAVLDSLRPQPLNG